MRVFRALRGKRLLLLTVILLMVVSIAYMGYKPLERRLFGVRKDVFFLDQCLTGMFPHEVRPLLREMEAGFALEPVDAKEDLVYAGGVIPHLAGFRLDVENTLEMIMAAKPGEVVTPLLQAVEPGVSLNDFPESALYRGNPLKKQVAFMINVAWGSEHLPAMLEVLEREDTRVTFFLTGRWAEKNEAMVRELLSRGHELASHGYDDGIVLKGLSVEEAAADILKSLQIIEGYGKEKVRYVTPHKGEHDAAALTACHGLDVRMVLWSLDTADWMKPGVEKMLVRTVEKVFNGAIILMHPTEAGAEYLTAALPQLREAGFNVVPVATLFNPHERNDMTERAQEP